MEDAYTKALSINNQIKSIDNNIYALIKPYGAIQKSQTISAYDMQKEFEKLYTRLKTGEFLKSYEQGELVMYYAVYKDSDIYKGKNLSPVINPEEFPNCDVWVNMMLLKINKEKVRAGIYDSIREIYNNLENMNDSIRTSEEYVKILENESEDAIKELNNGTISEFNKLKIENDYKINKLELNKLKRTKENLERTLKKTLGISLDAVIEIIPSSITEKDLRVPDLRVTVDKALLNRQEITVPKMNLLTAKIQMLTLDDYLTFIPKNENLKMSKGEVLASIDNLENNIKLQQEFVTQDINNKYIDVINLKRNLEIEDKKLNNLKKNYDAANQRFKSGTISSRNFHLVKLNYETGKANYDKAIRDLASGISKLNSACGV